MNKGSCRPSEELKHFTNREKEKDVLTRYMNTPEGNSLPILMFYGVGGIGKTWLTKRLRQMLGEPPFVNMPGQQPVPSVRLDMDSNSGGARFHSDPATAYAEIRRQFDVECPSFDLAYAMLRYKQGVQDETEFRHGSAFRDAWDFIGEAGNATANSIPGGNLVVWAAKKITGRIGRDFDKTSLGKFLLSNAGNAEFFDLRKMDVDDLYRILPQRLGADLDARLPHRSGKATYGVLILDTVEAVLAGIENAAQQYERVRWIVSLYEHTNHLLIVMAGRDRLTWEEVDSDWANSSYLELHLVGGLSRHDAETFLGSCGVTEGRLQKAVMRVCVDVEANTNAQTEIPYHPYSLALCADTILKERSQGIETDPHTFDMAPGDYDQLAQRFLKSLANDAEADWIARLSLPVRFDEAAARHAYSSVSNSAQNAAWENLKDYSFVTPSDREGWWTLHPSMRQALRKRLGDPNKPGDAQQSHSEWREYWYSRAESDTDDLSMLAWYHAWCLEPDAALRVWKGLAERTRSARQPDMVLHYRLLGWWLPTNIESESSPDTASALMSLGDELLEASQGNRARNLQKAIAYFETATRVYTEVDFPKEWLTIQNNLGIAYRDLRTGDRGANLQKAIDCHTAVLRIYTETNSPQAWASTQGNLGIIYESLPTGDRGANLQKAIDCHTAALSVFTEADFPEGWAAGQGNLGSAIESLPTGDRGDNLRKAIACYTASLRVYTEADFPDGWAVAQNNLGVAYEHLPTGDLEADLQKAIASYTAALRFYTEANFPEDWARTQSNLGGVFKRLPTGDQGDNLQKAIASYTAALRFYTESDFPQEWAMTQHNLGDVYQSLPTGDRGDNLRKAIACYTASLRVRTEADFPQEWVMTQYGLAFAYQYLPTGDRGENLQKAIACYEAALRIYTETYFPQGWSAANFMVALAHSELQDRDAARQAMKNAANGFHSVGLDKDAQDAEVYLNRSDWP